MSGSLEHSPADVIRQLIVDLGHGTAPADAGSWPAYVGQKTDSPDATITVYDTAGKNGGREMIGGVRFEHAGVQVLVRATEHRLGYTKAQAIATALDEGVAYTGVTVASTDYVVYAITRTSNVLAIGKEEDTNRDLFTINAIVALRQLS